jgi:glycosyltransferase involved in cell wall biosynthesis
MRCPALEQLPVPPKGKTGWPWTEESPQLPEAMLDGGAWPKISIVTPSYNQGEFIEETIRSVLLQGYPDVEFIIIDGNSTDHTIEVIKKYGPWISFWVSEDDQGQAHALNKGFHKATGVLIGWQNSDDYYGLRAFERCALIAQRHPDADVFHGTSHFVNETGAICQTIFTKNFILTEQPDSFPLFNFSNQSMLFNHRIFERGLFLDESYAHAMDNEFFVRLIISGCKFQFVPGLTGTCRLHKAAKTFYQEDVALFEAASICINTLKSKHAAAHIRRLAVRGFRTILIALFRKHRMREFRAGTRTLVKFGGLKMLSAKLAVRYLISLLGASVVKRVLGWKKTKIRCLKNLSS